MVSQTMKPLKLAFLGLSISAISLLLFYPASGINVTFKEAVNPNAPVWLLAKFFKATFYLGFVIILLSIYPFVQKILKWGRE